MRGDAPDPKKLDEDLQFLRLMQDRAKIYLFRPNRPQRDLVSSDSTYRCLFGANKTGKSTIGIVEDISYCVGFRPYLPKEHPRYKTPFKPPVRVMVFAESWDKIEEIIVPKFKEWSPKGWIKPVKRQGYTRGFEFISGPGKGSEIRFATYEMDSEKLEGADYHFYHFDEPPPFSHWAPVTRGIVVHGGKVLLTLTLLSEGWIWDEIWERAEAGDPDYYGVVGTIEENFTLDPEAIARFSKSLDETEREVRLHGKPQHLQGRVFKHFQVKEPWVVEDWDVPREWPTVRAFDPHIAKPVAVIWAKITPMNQIVITDELFDDRIATMDEFRRKLLTIEEERHPNVALSIMDSAGSAPGGLGGSSYFDLFKRYGIPCRAAKKSNKHARLMETAERFKLDTFTGQPGIVIFKSCQGLIWELKRYVHPTLKTGSRTDKWKEVPEGKFKKDDDRIDDLLYIVAENPRFEWLQPESMVGMMAEDYSPTTGSEWQDAVHNSSY